MADIRLVLDEHIGTAVASGLRRRGVSAHTVAELGRRSISDESQLRLTTADDQAFVTYDDDYLVLAAEFAARRETHSGVISLTRTDIGITSAD